MTLGSFELRDESAPPFDLDFLRAIGFRFGRDWDGEILIEAPESVDVERLSALVESYSAGIAGELEREGRVAQRVCVGGPMNGQAYDEFSRAPILFHMERACWAVYGFRPRPGGDVLFAPLDDLRAWFVGTATNRQAARQIWWEAVKGSCPRL